MLENVWVRGMSQMLSSEIAEFAQVIFDSGHTDRLTALPTLG